jgi:hypothetical protein
VTAATTTGGAINPLGAQAGVGEVEQQMDDEGRES